jgi:hypothetical protein
MSMYACRYVHLICYAFVALAGGHRYRLGCVQSISLVQLHSIAMSLVCAMAAVLALSCFAPVHGTGAYCSLWVVDLGGAPDDYVGRELLQKNTPDYGVNRYVCFASHASQYWFRVYGVYFENAIEDVSDAFVPIRSGKRVYKDMGWMSMLLVMLTLFPLFQIYGLPWFEVIVHGYNYDEEDGVRATVRHYVQPRIWWLRVGIERSIGGRMELYKTFMETRLPKFLLHGDYNFSAWWPYWQVDGPVYFSYCPPLHRTIKECFFAMLAEENEMAAHHGRPMPSKKVLMRLIKIYNRDYVEGRYLTRSERLRLQTPSRM